MKILGPVAFDAMEAIALRDGRKTQMRDFEYVFDDRAAGKRKPSRFAAAGVGDLFWIKEPYCFWQSKDGFRDGVGYRAEVGGGFPRAPAHLKNVPCKFHMGTAEAMPRYLSRSAVQVTARRVHALAEITAEDALAEGMRDCMLAGAHGFAPPGFGAQDWAQTPQGAFRNAWERRHGRGSWARNPRVVALTLRFVDQDADLYLQAQTAPAPAEAP